MRRRGAAILRSFPELYKVSIDRWLDGTEKRSCVLGESGSLRTEEEIREDNKNKRETPWIKKKLKKEVHEEHENMT